MTHGVRIGVRQLAAAWWAGTEHKTAPATASGRIPKIACAIACLLLGNLLSAAQDADVLRPSPFAARSGPPGATMFRALTPEETGVVTENRYADPKMWAERFHELEVGAVGTGVAIGDYDGDGRADIFVVSKTESCRLFRNLGNWKFEDVTEKAGVADRGDAAGIWKQGVTFVDVNNDGRLDIYLCRFAAPNLLYVNQGDGTFRDEAAARGLAVNDSSVMAAFCDYDRDGWLDVLVQTNLLDRSVSPFGQRNHLFRNNGDGTFANVTDRAGIEGVAQGHSATWWDHDHDGWLDLYVANDFAPADKLYRNNGDGTFSDVLNQAVPYTPYSSMGADLGDVNNDGLIDFLVADMAATTHEKDQRTMAATRGLASDPTEKEAHVAPQYLRNTLFLGTGRRHCLEAGFLAGVAATDWTWSVRFEDLDNDGWLDLHVTNGMIRESHNTDLIERVRLAQSPAEKLRVQRSSPLLAEANLAYRNRGYLQFENVSAAWGLDEKGVSFGAAFGDLDGDGDLDLIYTNYQQGATLLRNDSATGHAVVVALRGTHSNRFGVGATVQVETAAGRQVRQLALARGVLSSSEPVLHFGLGDATRINRLVVTWPDGGVQAFSDLEVDRKYTITESDTTEARDPAGLERPSRAATTFTEVGSAIHFSWLSREVNIDESGQDPLLPMRQNRRGPALAVGDLNGDGRDDVALGGTPQDPTRLLLAAPDGTFAVASATGLTTGQALNDGPLLVFDANADGRSDLLVTKSGVAMPAGAVDYQPRLWLGDGPGRFAAAPEGALPLLPASVGAVAAADFERVGRLGVFLGARVLPGLYPFAPKSALWANRDGKFVDVTDQLAPGLRQVGMVTAALWSDVDDDGWPDLLVALEWGHVKYFHNDQGKRFSDWTERAGFAAAGTGWWSSLAAADFNGDGRQDYVAGNVGLNTQYRADPAHPALLFSGDLKGDGTLQLLEAYYEGDRLHPWRTRKDLAAAIPAIRRRFPSNDAYARATLPEIVGEESLASADRFAATEFRSGVFLSQPDGGYRFGPLPRIAQIAPLQGTVAGDFNGDGHADIYAVQNSYAPIPSVGRFSGGLSQLLLGDGRGGFDAVPVGESDLLVTGDAKALVVLDFDENGWPDFLVTRNNASTLAFRHAAPAGPTGAGRPLHVRLRGRAGNPAAIGARVRLELSDGTKQSCEIHAGAGYFSQSTAGAFLGWRDDNPPRGISVRWPWGEETRHVVPAGVKRLVLSPDES